MNMHNLCAKCNVCGFPVDDAFPVLSALTNSDVQPIILVIDSSHNSKQWIDGQRETKNLLGDDQDFTYTSSIRCFYNKIEPDEKQKALQKCSVWTNSLIEGRAIIISTVEGLTQMHVGEGKAEGAIFKNEKVGVVIVVPPLYTFNDALHQHYKPKVQRALKEISGR